MEGLSETHQDSRLRAKMAKPIGPIGAMGSLSGFKAPGPLVTHQLVFESPGPLGQRVARPMSIRIGCFSDS